VWRARCLRGRCVRSFSGVTRIERPTSAQLPLCGS
jgi:hypothetical protein